MAKKTGTKERGYKSRAIRDYVSDHPAAGPKEVSTELAKIGVAVSPAFVSTVKSSLTKKGRRRKTTARRQQTDVVDVDRLIKAKRLADALGGVDKAKLAIDTLARITG